MRWLGIWGVLLFFGCDQDPKGLPPDMVTHAFLDAYVSGNMDNAATWITPKGKTYMAGLKHDLRKFSVSLDTQYILMGFREISPDTMMAEVVWDTFPARWDTVELLVIKHKYRWRVDFERMDPVGVARLFLNAFHHNDLETAKRYVTPAAMRDLMMVEEMFTHWTGPNIVITGLQYGKENKRAVVLYREEGSLLEKKINLMRYKGYWRVVFTKFPDFEES